MPHTPNPPRSFFGKLSSALSRNGAGDESTEIPEDLTSNLPSSDMRLRVSEFEAARVEDVMIPRAEIVAIEASESFGEVVKQFAKATHSRLPVYRESLDDPIGFVHIKDVVAAIADQTEAEDPQAAQPPELVDMIRDILYVPASMKLSDLLVKMQSSRIHLALVVDEYGGTDGLVSLEDLVEEIVGEIEDEHDEDAPGLVQRGRGVWDCDARMEIVDVNEQASLELGLPDYEDDIDTLGGVVFAIAGRVPQRGEIIRHPKGIDFEILDADPRRIKRLRLRCPADGQTPPVEPKKPPLNTEGSPS